VFQTPPRHQREEPNVFAETNLAPGTPAPSQEVRSYDEFVEWHAKMRTQLEHRAEVELGLIKNAESYTIDGYCAVCDKATSFLVDYQYSFVDAQNRRIPNWRERLECVKCRLNCRMRGALHFLRDQMSADPGSYIYVTEQITPMYAAVKERYANTHGSEYLGAGIASGTIRGDGVRHEDITALSFGDSSFNYVLSFDVLEHVPDYKKALQEVHRVLVPGGELLLSVPFALGAPTTLTRAVVEGDTIRHLEEPEYHGDPVTGSVLCYYDFGWSLLEDIKAAGFKDVSLHFYWSKLLGYLGGFPFLIRASR
jgi:SAM-dependent methyltransferase